MDIYEGDSVVVKATVQDSDLGICIGGWQGTVTEVSADKKFICIEWDWLTLKGMPDSVITKCEEEGWGWSEMHIETQEVELAEPRDQSKKDLAEVKRQIEEKHAWDYLGEEGIKIKEVLANVNLEDIRATHEAWKSHLRNVLLLPFEAEISDFQEGTDLQVGNKVIVLGFARVDDFTGVNMQLDYRGQPYIFPLCNLESVDRNSSNYEHLRTYLTWFDCS